MNAAWSTRNAASRPPAAAEAAAAATSAAGGAPGPAPDSLADTNRMPTLSMARWKGLLVGSLPVMTRLRPSLRSGLHVSASVSTTDEVVATVTVAAPDVAAGAASSATPVRARAFASPPQTRGPVARFLSSARRVAAIFEGSSRGGSTVAPTAGDVPPACGGSTPIDEVPANHTGKRPGFPAGPARAAQSFDRTGDATWTASSTAAAAACATDKLLSSRSCRGGLGGGNVKRSAVKGLPSGNGMPTSPRSPVAMSPPPPAQPRSPLVF